VFKNTDPSSSLFVVTVSFAMSVTFLVLFTVLAVRERRRKDGEEGVSIWYTVLAVVALLAAAFFGYLRYLLLQ
jgi:hypothetical protein